MLSRDDRTKIVTINARRRRCCIDLDQVSLARPGNDGERCWRKVPTLILPSIQVNVRAGQLPPPDENGVSYLRIPLNTLPLRP